MAKKKSKLKEIPRAYLTLAIVSLGINALMVVALIVASVMEQRGTFDYALVNNGINRMCSDQFRQTVEQSSKKSGESENSQKLRVAALDYPCSKGTAKQFYEDGFKNYARSLGLNPDN